MQSSLLRLLQLAMSYYHQLHPWCIIQCLPNAQTLIVARLRRRNNADAHLRLLQQLTPTATYHLIFDLSEPSHNNSAHLDAYPSSIPFR